MDQTWVRELRDACLGSDLGLVEVDARYGPEAVNHREINDFARHRPAFFYKQNAINGRKVSLPELDGRQWTEMPTVRT